MSEDATAGDLLPTGFAETVEQDRDHGDRDRGEMPHMVDRFLIEEELGAGGMGRVYVAYDPSLDRRVAVKLLRDEIRIDIEKAHTRMAREARAMARLRHPNVVTVHEVGTHEGRVFIVMEYVAGGTLRDWRHQTPEPDWKQIVAMYVLAGRGLAAAHDAGLVHRDFKPDNVLVGEDGRVLVSDFGIANVYGDESSPEASSPDDRPARLTRAGSVIGTPPYMSPEQHLGSPVDARTDQFAFCAALYEALYGTQPFVGESAAEIAERAIEGEITPPTRDCGAPSRIEAAVLRGLRSKPAERFPAMAPLLAELATERRSPTRWIALVAGVAVVASVLIWLVARDPSEPSAAPPVAARPIGLIAVESFGVTIGSSAGPPEWRDAIGDVIALLLADIDGVKAVGPTYLLGADGVREAREKEPSASDWRAAESKANAAYTVRATIEERSDHLHASVRLVAPDRTTTSLELERPRVELAKLLDDITDGVARTIDPRKRLDRNHANNRARSLLAIGDERLRNGDYQAAWPFLEQAVDADPTYFEAWYALALTRSWVLAPESQVFAALDAALATAPTELKKKLVAGEARYVHHDLAGARAILESLAKDPSLTKVELRDVVYFLGEAHWHDGHHKVGVGYLQQALDLDLRFKLPVQHVAEYAAANRNLAMMHQYTTMLASSSRQFRESTAFAIGHYDEVARTGSYPGQLYAALVLGQTPTPEMEAPIVHSGIEWHIYRAARALGVGDAPAGRGELDEIWKGVLAQRQAGELPDGVYYSLRIIGDAVLCAGSVDEARRLVGFLAAQSRTHPVRGYQRLSILAAPLVGDRAWIVRTNLTDRDRQLADAIEAEMAGDRGRAADLLAKLVADPSPYWDYPERIALLRNLRALQRTAEARALCEDTLRPAIFQWAYLPARRACQQR